jgi:hypothetical protein
MSDRPANAEPVFADIDAATRRLMSALERANREIAERLDAAIGTIRSVLDPGET